MQFYRANQADLTIANIINVPLFNQLSIKGILLLRHQEFFFANSSTRFFLLKATMDSLTKDFLADSTHNDMAKTLLAILPFFPSLI